MDMTAKLVSLLTQCGLVPEPRARVLVYFLSLKGAETTSREIERRTDLRQPEVSLAISFFTEKKWVTILPPKEAGGKGRPEKHYILSVPAEVIYKSIASTVEREVKGRMELLEQLKTALLAPPKPSAGEGTITKKEEQKVLTA